MENNHLVIENLKDYVSAYDSKKEAALDLMISPQYLNDILKGSRPIPERVANLLGWKLQQIWYKII